MRVPTFLKRYRHGVEFLSVRAMAVSVSVIGIVARSSSVMTMDCAFSSCSACAKQVNGDPMGHARCFICYDDELRWVPAIMSMPHLPNTCLFRRLPHRRLPGPTILSDFWGWSDVP